MSDTNGRKPLVYRQWTREEFMRHMERICASPEYRKLRAEADAEMELLKPTTRPETA